MLRLSWFWVDQHYTGHGHVHSVLPLMCGAWIQVHPQVGDGGQGTEAVASGQSRGIQIVQDDFDKSVMARPGCVEPERSSNFALLRMSR